MQPSDDSSEGQLNPTNAPFPGVEKSSEGLIANLPPASFSFVMATGIVSTGLDLYGAPLPALILFIVAILGGMALAVATLLRLVGTFGLVMRDVRSPGRAFGFFTIVAAANVLGTRFEMHGWTKTAMAMAVLGAIMWVVLNYTLPTELLVAERKKPIIAEINGSWFLWVVGTQSVAVAAAMTSRLGGSALMGAAAVGLWGVGVMLYLIVATLVTIRLLTHSVDPASLSPTYWIYMGATAISVLAGSQILRLPAEMPILETAAPVVAGVSYILWALGLWWIPLLLLFGIWRHVLRHRPLRYEISLWSIVFPLGMYASASMLFGRGQGLDFMVVLGQIIIWVALLAWLASALAMALAAITWLRHRRNLRETQPDHRP
ncbi:tellurite resistance/C4-dicarboxylate transporter family protein [Paeniglutamicibacter cryotolerans]|uniref:Tellurite resistance protein TehA-like permease n=1 Tax=Paeniglutamicibacter cryotolerans TaxID=670079 RepID=A0A839QHQ5_9MICC|nr:tellurite resistance/C4-dicarboxylate transporter family protein [Paeniglutamicibacter cryotolerans]MBB2994035.1 tellurite resistance protein TehA-like permease [Paeniglutamicibacter cryotolerans]